MRHAQASDEARSNAPASRYGITVGFQLAEGAAGAFLPLVRANAAASLRLEPGCHCFDVLVPLQTGACDVMLFEIYADKAAFQTHLDSWHFRDFDKATQAMVIGKTIAEFAVLEIGKE